MEHGLPPSKDELSYCYTQMINSRLHHTGSAAGLWRCTHSDPGFIQARIA